MLAPEFHEPFVTFADQRLGHQVKKMSGRWSFKSSLQEGHFLGHLQPKRNLQKQISEIQMSLYKIDW